MKFKEWLETWQPALPFMQEEDPPPKIRHRTMDNYVRDMTRGSRDTERAAQMVVSAPLGSAMAPQNEKIVNIIPKAATIKLPNERGVRYVALVLLETEEPQDSPLKEYQKKVYRLLAYYQKGENFNKSEIQFARPIGGLQGMGGYYTHIWVDPEYRGKQEGVPNIFKLIMSYAKKMGIHGLMPETKACEKCDVQVHVGSRPTKCPNCGHLAQPLTSKSLRTAQAKYDWKRSKG